MAVSKCQCTKRLGCQLAQPCRFSNEEPESQRDHITYSRLGKAEQCVGILLFSLWMLFAIFELNLTDSKCFLTLEGILYCVYSNSTVYLCFSMADRNGREKAEAGRLLESRILGISLGSTRRLNPLRLREVICGYSTECDDAEVKWSHR